MLFSGLNSSLNQSMITFKTSFNSFNANRPWTNFRIWSYWSLAWLSLTKSILFCRIRMCFSLMISMAAKCSDVCGWGQDSFPAVKRKPIHITLSVHRDIHHNLKSWTSAALHMDRMRQQNAARSTSTYAAGRTDEKKCSIHNSGSIQHSGHEDVVPRAVHERYVSTQQNSRM